MNFNITKGKIQSAQKVVIYGPEGIGKSTFAAQFPKPLFIDTEGSTKSMDVARFDKPTSWTMLNQQIAYVKSSPNICKTLVIDTIDWAEQLCLDEICARYQKKGIEDFGYGNGYVYEKEEFGRFLNSLEELVEKGVNICLTAHAQLRKFEQPDELGAYDRWELKLGKKTSSQISPLVKEWADMVLFANYETFAVQTDKEGKKFKAQGGTRVMYTEHHPCWDAKNRHGLAPKLPFEYQQIAQIFGNQVPTSVSEPTIQLPVQSQAAPQQASQPVQPQQVPIPDVVTSQIDAITDLTPEVGSLDERIPKELRDLMMGDHVTEKELRTAIWQAGYFPESTPVAEYPLDFVMGCVVPCWQSAIMPKFILPNRDTPFSDDNGDLPFLI